MSEDKQIKILIVDDDLCITGILRHMLVRRGYQVEEAEDGRQALNKIDQNKPDIILLDAIMPGMDGFETYRRLKENPDTRDIPIIFCADMPVTEKIKVEVYLKKPLSIEELYAKITEIAHKKD